MGDGTISLAQFREAKRLLAAHADPPDSDYCSGCWTAVKPRSRKCPKCGVKLISLRRWKQLYAAALEGRC